ncbi:MAG TPA: SPOR domain-containing protein [Bacteroidales bacterium]|nr:SPOR domain-containing protein [Bacteroidales bacterium]
MKIGNYISELLFEHDPVVLTGFGTFSTKYIPARFIPEEKKIESPRKVADFLAGKAEGGSLLIEYASKKEQKPAEAVEKYISELVAEIKVTLASGQKVQLDKLGTLLTDAEGKILFEPNLEVNYLADTTGMAAISEPSAAKPTSPKPQAARQDLDNSNDKKTPKDTVPVETMRPQQAVPSNLRVDQSKPSKSSKRYELAEKDQPPVTGITRQELPRGIKWLAWLIVPLGILIIILVINWRHIIGLQPDEPRQVSPTEAIMAEPGAEQMPGDTPAETNQAALPEVTGPIVPEPGRMVYYIVVGAFQDEMLANRQVSALQAQGARQASVFMRTDLGYHRVCYGFFYTLAEAEAQLPHVQQNIQAGAWILPRRN